MPGEKLQGILVIFYRGASTAFNYYEITLNLLIRCDIYISTPFLKLI